MKLNTLLTTAFSVATVNANGCGKGLPDGVTDLSKTYSAKTHDGRTFYYHLPSAYDTNRKHPAYLSFHGATKNALQQEQLSGLSLSSFNHHGIAVYPESKDGYWLSHPGISQDSPNDIDFVIHITKWLDAHLCIDSSQLYAMGKSNGGGLVNLLACNATTASTFAAFAGVSGAYYQNKLARNCAPGRPVPFISFHGLNDTTIPYTGKKFCGQDPNPDNACADGDTSDVYKTTYPIEQWLKDWNKRNGVSDAQPAITTGLYGGLVTKSAWSRSGFTNVTSHYKENDLGHVWPSTYPNPDCESQSKRCPMGHYTFNATSVILDFFSQWTL